MYNFIYLPELQRQLALTWPPAVSVTYVLAVGFNVVWALAVWSFFRTHCSAPGSITKEWRSFVRKQNLEIYVPRFAWQPAQATWCSKCEDVRPERTHHCSATNECVLRFDHYCPWTANSIGFLNHKFFLLVAFYTFLSNLMSLVTMLPVSVLLVIGWVHSDPDRSRWQHSLLVVTCVLDVPIVYLFGSMCRDHVSQAYHNITSVEANYTNMPNPYDLGSRSLNVSEVMGDFGLDWFFPIMPWKPRSDGISFARKCEPHSRPEKTGGFVESAALLKHRYTSVGPVEDSFEEESEESVFSDETDD